MSSKSKLPTSKEKSRDRSKDKVKKYAVEKTRKTNEDSVRKRSSSKEKVGPKIAKPVARRTVEKENILKVEKPSSSKEKSPPKEKNKKVVKEKVDGSKSKDSSTRSKSKEKDKPTPSSKRHHESNGKSLTVKAKEKSKVKSPRAAIGKPSPRQSTKTEVTVAPDDQGQSEVEPDYEDDFEDYEDDFVSEDDDESESLALNNKSEEVLSDAHSSPVIGRKENEKEKSSEKSPKLAKKASVPARIDFDSAAHATTTDYTAVSAIRKRFQRLSKLIELDTSKYDILNIVDNSNFVNFGVDASNGAHVGTQTGDDVSEAETQTTTCAWNTAWTQHPIVGRVAAVSVAQEDDDEAKMGRNVVKVVNPHEEDDAKLARLLSSSAQERTISLNGFVHRTAQLLLDLIDADTSLTNEHRAVHSGNRSSISFATAMTDFTIGQLATSSHLSAIGVSGGTRSIDVLGAHFIADSPLEELKDKSLMCRWSVEDNTSPTQLYVTEGEIAACCFSPDGQVVFAGLSDGSLTAWDSTEYRRLHPISIPWPTNGQDVQLRSPTYSTRFSTNVKDGPRLGHACVAINAARSTDNQTHSICQLTALSKVGQVSVYLCVRSTGQDAYEITKQCETDVGITPMGAIRLVHVTSVSAVLDHDISGLVLHATCLSCGADGNSYYVGMSDGRTIEVGRSVGGARKVYASDTSYASCVTSVAMPSFGDSGDKASTADVIAVSDESGTLCVFRQGRVQPVIVAGGSTIDHVLWSPIDSTTLYTISKQSISVWHLTKSLTAPSATQRLDGKTTVTRASIAKSGDMESIMVLGLENGTVQVHHIDHKSVKIHKIERLHKLVNNTV